MKVSLFLLLCLVPWERIINIISMKTKMPFFSFMRGFFDILTTFVLWIIQIWVVLQHLILHLWSVGIFFYFTEIWDFWRTHFSFNISTNLLFFYLSTFCILFFDSCHPCLLHQRLLLANRICFTFNLKLIFYSRVIIIASH